MQSPAELARLAEQLDEGDWYQFLDELDVIARRRRQRQVEPERPNGHDRDALAAWLARRHLLVDRAIREVWYLPKNSPSQEIRFLEVNDQLTGPDPAADQVEAIDFGLDIEGAQLCLYVADITSEQLEQIKRGELHLPKSWTVEGNMIWRRGGEQLPAFVPCAGAK
jgi:hypothetical protein